MSEVGPRAGSFQARRGRACGLGRGTFFFVPSGLRLLEARVFRRLQVEAADEPSAREQPVRCRGVIGGVGLCHAHQGTMDRARGGVPSRGAWRDGGLAGWRTGGQAGGACQGSRRSWRESGSPPAQRRPLTEGRGSRRLHRASRPPGSVAVPQWPEPARADWPPSEPAHVPLPGGPQVIGRAAGADTGCKTPEASEPTRRCHGCASPLLSQRVTLPALPAPACPYLADSLPSAGEAPPARAVRPACRQLKKVSTNALALLALDRALTSAPIAVVPSDPSAGDCSPRQPAPRPRSAPRH